MPQATSSCNGAFSRLVMMRLCLQGCQQANRNLGELFDTECVVGHVEQVVQRVLAQLHHHAQPRRLDARADQRDDILVVQLADDRTTLRRDRSII